MEPSPVSCRISAKTTNMPTLRRPYDDCRDGAELSLFCCLLSTTPGSLAQHFLAPFLRSLGAESKSSTSRCKDQNQFSNKISSSILCIKFEMAEAGERPLNMPPADSKAAGTASSAPPRFLGSIKKNWYALKHSVERISLTRSGLTFDLWAFIYTLVADVTHLLIVLLRPGPQWRQLHRFHDEWPNSNGCFVGALTLFLFYRQLAFLATRLLGALRCSSPWQQSAATLVKTVSNLSSYFLPSVASLRA